MRKIPLSRAILLVFIALVVQYVVLTSFGSTATYGAILKRHYARATISQNYQAHQYLVAGYRVSLELPEGTEVQVGPDQGEQMLFSIYFVNHHLAFRGYIQLWKIEDLESFLRQSKSLSAYDFTSYQMKNLQDNHGFQTEWSADFGDAYISGKEYWQPVNHTEQILRLSFFTDTSAMPDELGRIFDDIKTSLRVDAMGQI